MIQRIPGWIQLKIVHAWINKANHEGDQASEGQFLAFRACSRRNGNDLFFVFLFIVQEQNDASDLCFETQTRVGAKPVGSPQSKGLEKIITGGFQGSFNVTAI